MPQLLKLLDDNQYVYRYRVCKDGEIVQDIFWSHPDSIKLFNTFSIVLVIHSTYKTNKYILSLAIGIFWCYFHEKYFFDWVCIFGN